MSLRNYLYELSQEDGPIITSKLVNLSGLTPEELPLFREAWPGMAVSRRRQILGRLVELAEDNVELDFETVFRFCLRDEDEEVQVKAIEGLWECEDRSLMEELIGLLRGCDKESVRAAAATALGQFALMVEMGELRPSDAERLEDALIEVIEDEAGSVEIRRRAIEAIGAICQDRVKELIRRAYEGPVWRLKLSAVHAMGRNCDPVWLPILLRELDNADTEMRYEAARACGELDDERAIPYLVNLIGDDDFEVQASAIMALGHIGGDLARQTLQECLKSPDESVRDVAEEALENLEFGEDPLSFRLRP